VGTFQIQIGFVAATLSYPFGNGKLKANKQRCHNKLSLLVISCRPQVSWTRNAAFRIFRISSVMRDRGAPRGGEEAAGLQPPKPPKPKLKRQILYILYQTFYVIYPSAEISH
jgi:hypothetical protein